MRRAALLLAALSGTVFAGDAQVHGFLDLRVIAPPEESSWTDGGLGKSRYGGNRDPEARLGGVALEGRWQALPSLSTFADVQFHTDDRNAVELVEAYARWRPVSISAWRYSVKAGAFFPAISLENEGVGWSSLWTLTPSAINTWAGEELRTMGAEARLEYRFERQALEVAGSLYEWSDPAGELISARGWSLGDLTYGIGSRTREPDVYATSTFASTPRHYDPWQEIDHKPGWTGELTWRSGEYGRVTLLRYDNNADSTKFGSGSQPVYAWHTYFWSLAGETQVGPVTLMAQGMDGGTDLEAFASETYFRAAYLLAGYDLGAWRPALRVDSFSTSTEPDFLGNSEHGNALTAALNWRPRQWLRLTGEVLRIDSTREQRRAEGVPPRTIDAQGQVAVRVMF